MSLTRRFYNPPEPKMPSGLIELMDGLTRDVLKNNPTNIYDFCARHIEILLEIRDGKKVSLSLDEKIAKAQNKIKQRNEQRQREFDKKYHVALFTCPNEVQNEAKSNDNSGVEESISELKHNSTEVNVLVNDELKNDQKLIEIISDVISAESKDKDVDFKDTSIQEGKDSDNTNESVVIFEDNQEINEKDLVTHNLSTEKDAFVSVENSNEEIQFTNFSSETENINEDNITDTINDSQDANITHSEYDDNTVENRVKRDQDESVLLRNDGIEIAVQNNSDCDSEIQIKIDIDVNQDVGQENGSTASVISANTTVEDGNQSDIMIEKIPQLYTDTNQIVIEHCEDFNESEKLQDDKILAEISCSKNIEELNEKDPDIAHDSESVPESSYKTDNTTNPNQFDLETAAITIQKVFRSFLFKTKTASYDEPTPVDINLLNDDKNKDENKSSSSIKDRRLLGISRMDTVLQTVNEEKSLSLSTDDSSNVSSAATIIQAHVRGFLTRNKFNLNKTISNNSLIDSEAALIPSFEADNENRKNKTVLNIHIVPEGGHFISRDESILTSNDLSLDCSPPSSVNLHPLGYDKSERRKQLKREDAIQSVSPPSNNSGKLSDDLDSVKEVLLVDNNTVATDMKSVNDPQDIVINKELNIIEKSDLNLEIPKVDTALDEMDVVTPFVPVEDRNIRESDNTNKLLHSGEFHDIVIPTNVTRSDTSVVREFQNVLVYFILWNN